MNAPIVTSINDAAGTWAYWVTNAAWQASLLAVVAMLAVRLGRRWPAPLRAALLLVALVKFLTPPTLPSPVGLFGFAGPVPSVRSTAVAPEPVTSPAPAATVASAADVPVIGSASGMNRTDSARRAGVAGDHTSPRVGVATRTSPPPPLTAAEAPARPSLTPTAILMLIHAAGTCAVLVWLAAGVLRLRRLARGAAVLRDGPLYDRTRAVARRLGVRAPRELLVSPAPVPPMAFGLFRRRVMLPASVVAALGPEQLEAVLAHELAHHARRDTLVTAVQWLALAVWWFNPVAWLLARVLRNVREECCDDLVLSARLVTPAEYCRTMLAAAERLVTQMGSGRRVALSYAAALAVAEPMHPLGPRMRRILEPGRRPVARLRRGACAVVLVVAAVMLPGVRSPAQAQAQPNNPPNAPVPDGSRVGGVVLSVDGTPVGGARVFLLRRGTHAGGNTRRETKSGPDGTFAFDAVAPAEYRAWAEAGNLASRDKLMRGTGITVPNAGAGEPRRLRLVVMPGRTLKATVTSAADGKPIAGARLHFPSGDLGHAFTTDDAGTVTMEAIAPGTWRVEATAPGKAKVMKEVNVAAAPETAIEFALADGGAVFGKVTGPEGKPLERARINVYPGDSGSPTGYVETGPDGAYRLDHLPLGQEQRLYVAHDQSHDKYERVTLTRDRRERELNVSLPARAAGGSVAGTVVDLQDNPIADAQIFHGSLSGRNVKPVTTDAAGRFRLDGIDVRPRAVPEQITVRAKGWAPRVISVEPGTAAAPSQVTVRLTEPGHRVRGRVVNEKGEPVEGAFVEAGVDGTHNAVAGSTRTKGDGRFAFDSLPADAQFTVQAAGYQSGDFVKLPLDRDTEVPVVLKREAELVGRIVDAATGEPVPRFNLKLVQSVPGQEFGGAGGEFRLGRLSKYDQTRPLIVSAPGYPTQYFEGVPFAPAGDAKPTELRLHKNPPGHLRLAGKVLDADGKGRAGVEVRAVVYRLGEDNERRRLGFSWSMLKSGQLAIQEYVLSIESARTGADGSFVFESVPGDDVEIAYWGERMPQARVTGVGKLPAAQRERLELRIPKPGSLKGRLNREAFPAVAHLEVRSLVERSFVMKAPVKAAEDRYEIPDLPPGAFELFVVGTALRNPDGTFHFPFLARAQVEVAAGEARELDLGFGPAFVVAGRVTVGRKPMAGGTVALFLEAAGPEILRTTKTDADGRYRFAHVPPGRYALVATADKPVESFRTRQSPERKVVDVRDADVEQAIELPDPAGL